MGQDLGDLGAIPSLTPAPSIAQGLREPPRAGLALCLGWERGKPQISVGFSPGGREPLQGESPPLVPPAPSPRRETLLLCDLGKVSAAER